jgi:hypothetical protein
MLFQLVAFCKFERKTKASIHLLAEARAIVPRMPATEALRSESPQEKPSDGPGEEAAAKIQAEGGNVRNVRSSRPRSPHPECLRSSKTALPTDPALFTDPAFSSTEHQWGVASRRCPAVPGACMHFSGLSSLAAVSSSPRTRNAPY